MNLQHIKQLIACFLAAILFASGMCVEIADADSYFASQIQQESQTSRYRETDSIITSDYCTQELLQTNHSHYFRNSNRNNSLRNTRNRTTSSTSFIAKTPLFYYEEHHLIDVPTTTFNRIIIINYIHLQDGEK